MVMGAILSAIFGAIVGYIAGWVIELFPHFNSALIGGIEMLTGLDIKGETRLLFTGLGFILGVLAGVVQILARYKKR
ncbi:hypothetical protein [Methanocella arvoryzae]|uniref:hypothetical protein n=1 Tax=Methanocella arvoryzae TaxID=1175445 RepID=UPI0003257D93|nr:hypothetical protein [Methanocella arvoryzae]